MQGMVPSPGQPAVVNTIVTPASTAAYPKVAARVLGCIQIACGALASILHVVDLATWFSKSRSYSYIGASTPGIWTGTFFVMAGAMGIASSRDDSRCKVVGTMALSIICCVLTWVPMIPLSISLCIVAAIGGLGRSNDYKVTEVVNGLLILIGLVEFGISMAQAIICCRKVCCNQKQEVTTTTVSYVGPQGQIVTTGPVVLQNNQQFQPQFTVLNQPPQYTQTSAEYPSAPPPYSPGQAPVVRPNNPGQTPTVQPAITNPRCSDGYLTPGEYGTEEEPTYAYIDTQDLDRHDYLELKNENTYNNVSS